MHVRQCVERKKPQHARNVLVTLMVPPNALPRGAPRTIPIWQLIFQGLITARTEIQRFALEEVRPDSKR